VRNNGAPLLLDVSRLVWRRWAGVRPTGIDRICMAWLAHFADRAQATLLHRRGRHIMGVAASRVLFRLLAQADDGQRPLIRQRLQLAAWVMRHGPGGWRSLPGRGRLWLNVGHTGLDLPGLAEWVSSTDVKPVLMVHDLIPITHPQYCRAGEADRHRDRMASALAIAHGLIGNSHDTIDSLAQFAALQGQALAPCLVAWPGTPHLPLPAQRRDNNDFVVLGTIEGRKNHALLLDVWDRLVAHHGETAPRLLVIGRRGWACDDVLARLDSGGFGSRVIETGPLDDAAIAERLAGARALLFPSQAEGYGLPLVEALAAGVPVIASDLQVFHEIGQGVPDLLPPDAVDAWLAAITDYAVPDSAPRSAQMQRLRGFHAPDWVGHFSRVEPFLQQLGG
jgi:glycosyltransferase involved in cell wall biosynthesis